MRKIIASEFITVDGVIEDPGGSEKKDFGGWAFQFESGPAGDKFKLDEVMEAGTLLLGRVTYQGFAGAWPSRTGEFADKMNGMEKVVISTTISNPSWNNTRVIKDHVIEQVEKLKSQPGSDILVAGSAQLVRLLANNDLIDEFRLMVYPVILGKGKRLFKVGMGRLPLQLAKSTQIGDGIMILIYQPRNG